MIAIVFVALCLIYLCVNMFLVLQRNYKAHQFFKTKSPKLTVLQNPNIFHGHLLQVTWPDKNWRIITDLHKKYGPTFGFYMCEQPWVCTKDLDLLKLILVDQAHKHINRSKIGLPFKEINDSIMQVCDDDWRRIRRAVAPALTNHKVRSDEVASDIKSVLEKLNETLGRRMCKAEQETGKRAFIMDVHQTFQRYTLAVIFLITYKRDNIIDFDAEHDEWVDTIEAGARSITNVLVLASIMFPFLRNLLSFLTQFHPTGQIKLRIIDYITEATDINRVAREQHSRLQKRLSSTTGLPERSFSQLKCQGNFRRRLVDTIIDSFIEKKIGYDEFIGSTLFLLLAGFETTSDTITCLVWHLARNPEIQERLRKSITEEGIDSDYMIWCIQETIRWHPAVPLGTGRVLGEDVTVNGLFLAKGTFVMPSTHSIHHDSSIWPEANEFKPDRWSQAASFHPAAFMGFGLGPRNCVGGKLAIHEIKLVMQLLLTNYRIEKCPETSEEYDFSSPGLVYTLLDQPIVVRLVALESLSSESPSQ